MGIEWKDGKYGDHTADLGHGLTLGVFWEGVERLPDGAPRFNVSIFGRRLKERSADLEEGKRRAETIASKWMKEAIKKLSTSGITN